MFALRALWVIDTSQSGKLVASFRFPTAEFRARSSAGGQYVPIPTDDDFVRLYLAQRLRHNTLHGYFDDVIAHADVESFDDASDPLTSHVIASLEIAPSVYLQPLVMHHIISPHPFTFITLPMVSNVETADRATLNASWRPVRGGGPTSFLLSPSVTLAFDVAMFIAAACCDVLVAAMAVPPTSLAQLMPSRPTARSVAAALESAAPPEPESDTRSNMKQRQRDGSRARSTSRSRAKSQKVASSSNYNATSSTTNNNNNNTSNPMFSPTMPTSYPFEHPSSFTNPFDTDDDNLLPTYAGTIVESVVRLFVTMCCPMGCAVGMPAQPRAFLCAVTPMLPAPLREAVASRIGKPFGSPSRNVVGTATSRPTRFREVLGVCCVDILRSDAAPSGLVYVGLQRPVMDGSKGALVGMEGTKGGGAVGRAVGPGGLLFAIATRPGGGAVGDMCVHASVSDGPVGAVVDSAAAAGVAGGAGSRTSMRAPSGVLASDTAASQRALVVARAAKVVSRSLHSSLTMADITAAVGGPLHGIPPFEVVLKAAALGEITPARGVRVSVDTASQRVTLHVVEPHTIPAGCPIAQYVMFDNAAVAPLPPPPHPVPAGAGASTASRSRSSTSQTNTSVSPSPSPRVSAAAPPPSHTAAGGGGAAGPGTSGAAPGGGASPTTLPAGSMAPSNGRVVIDAGAFRLVGPTAVDASAPHAGGVLTVGFAFSPPDAMAAAAADLLVPGVSSATLGDSIPSISLPSTVRHATLSVSVALSLSAQRALAFTTVSGAAVAEFDFVTVIVPWCARGGVAARHFCKCATAGVADGDASTIIHSLPSHVHDVAATVTAGTVGVYRNASTSAVVWAIPRAQLAFDGTPIVLNAVVTVGDELPPLLPPRVLGGCPLLAHDVLAIAAAYPLPHTHARVRFAVPRLTSTGASAALCRDGMSVDGSVYHAYVMGGCDLAVANQLCTDAS